MSDALEAFLALAWTGLGIAVTFVIFQIYYLIHDEVASIGGIFGLALFFTLWLKMHLANRPIRVEKKDYTEEGHIGRHRIESDNIVGEIRGMYGTWKRKKAEDFDGLFTDMVLEKRNNPTPIF